MRGIYFFDIHEGGSIFCCDEDCDCEYLVSIFQDYGMLKQALKHYRKKYPATLWQWAYFANVKEIPTILEIIIEN